MSKATLSKDDHKRLTIETIVKTDPVRVHLLEVKVGMSITDILVNLKYIDIHRFIPRFEGGKYVRGNVDVMAAIDHIKLHDNYREREPKVAALKNILDDRRKVLQTRNKINSQLLACKRGTDNLHADTIDVLDLVQTPITERLKVIDKQVVKALKDINDPIANAALTATNVGPMTVAYCVAYIDLFGVFPAFDGEKKPHKRAGELKARHPSSLWAYVGLDKPAHERFQAGVKGGGNKWMRNQLYCLGDSQIKASGGIGKKGQALPLGAYNGIYRQYRERYENTERNTATGIAGRKGVYQHPWNADVNKGHRHEAARRMISKYFLFDWWYAGREIYGLPIEPAYPEAHLGGGHRTTTPAERGWVYERGSAAGDSADTVS